MLFRFATFIGLSIASTLIGFESFIWPLGPFERPVEHPVLSPQPESLFFCPIQEREIRWEKKHTFNPSAVVRNGKIYLIYRAEDDFGRGVGKHTSRLGIAESEDGIHFHRHPTPILYPDLDDQNQYEFPGGCEDPRIVETDEGTYVMTYTQWNRKIAVLAIATSEDLFSWEKWGYAFENEGREERRWSKSGSIICRKEGDRMVATKIHGKYWMYWGDGSIHLATSDDLISWKPLLDNQGELLAVLKPREGKFDSDIVEAGPPAILTDKGVALLYNGKNAIKTGDPRLLGRAYSAGEVLFDLDNPSKVISRLDDFILKPEMPFEMRGQYRSGAIFIEGLVHFQGQWLLYYGASDSKIGVAVCRDRE